MRRHAIPLCIALTWAAGFAPAARAQSPSPSPAPEAQRKGAAEERLALDVEGQVEKFLERQAEAGLPRFETSIEVQGKTPQIMIERFFGGLDVECGPVAVGAPTSAEMGAVRPTPPPTADLLALAQFALDKIKRRDKRSDRYFVYAVRRGADVSYQLRDTKVPVTWLYGVNGTVFELLDSFPDRDGAVRALRRRERGLADEAPSQVARAERAWGQSPCRPRRP